MPGVIDAALSSSSSAGARPGGSRLIAALNRHASERPNMVAVRTIGGASIKYGDLWREVSRLSIRLGTLSPGSVVAAVFPGGVEHVVWFCASIVAGVRILPMHAQIAGPEARSAAARAGAVAVVGGDGLGLEESRVRVDREAPSAPAAPCPAVRTPGGVVLGSSGTVGLPKLALRESASLDADAAGVISGLRLTQEDRVLACTPLSHSYGVDLLVGSLTAGAELVVSTQFDPELIATELERGVTVLPGVPFVFESLARVEARRAASFRLAVSAGSPLPRRVRAAFAAAWGLPVAQLYGATELGTVCVDDPTSSGFDPASVGRPLPGVSVRIVDPADPARSMTNGEEGHVAVRADSMLTRYLDGETPLVDGHLLTGDLGRLAADGRLHITGRLKLLIDVGAYKVNPFEVEAVLASHPGVSECVVVAAAASDTVQRVRAVVVPREKCPSADGLRQFLRERLSPVKVPRMIEFVDRLPKTRSGKVRRELV